MKITKLSKKLLWFAFSLIFSTLLFIPTVKAQSGATTPSPWLNTALQGGLQQTGTTAYKTPDKPSDIRVIIVYIIQIVLGLLGIIFIVLIIAAGYRWMTSAGNEEKIKSAQKTIAAATIGLLIIIAAFVITRYILARAIYVTSSNDTHKTIPSWGKNYKSGP